MKWEQREIINLLQVIMLARAAVTCHIYLYSACIIWCSFFQALCCHENQKFLFLADQYDSSSGSLQLISIKPMAAPPTYSHPASSDRSQDSAILNGEVRLDFIRDNLRRQPLTDHSLLTDLLMHFTHKKGLWIWNFQNC